jgi:hypothetical protein
MTMKRTREMTMMTALIMAAVLAATACGKATSSPVSPSSTAAAVASPSPSSGRVQVDGKIASINAPARSFQVASTTVVVPSSATLTSSSGQVEFKDLQVEMEIHVIGTMQGNVVSAEQVQVDDHGRDQGQPDPSVENETEFTGAIGSMGGACPSLTLSVAGKTVKTGAATAFLKAACTDLRSGTTVEVKGATQPDGSVMASRVQLEDDDVAEPEPGDQNETEFTGSVAAVTGSCPALSFSVGGRSVKSTSSTEFKDGSCGDVKSGVMLEVKGTAEKDGSVTASRLKFEK